MYDSVSLLSHLLRANVGTFRLRRRASPPTDTLSRHITANGGGGNGGGNNGGSSGEGMQHKQHLSANIHFPTGASSASDSGPTSFTWYENNHDNNLKAVYHRMKRMVKQRKRKFAADVEDFSSQRTTTISVKTNINTSTAATQPAVSKDVQPLGYLNITHENITHNANASGTLSTNYLTSTLTTNNGKSQSIFLQNRKHTNDRKLTKYDFQNTSATRRIKRSNNVNNNIKHFPEDGLKYSDDALLQSFIIGSRYKSYASNLDHYRQDKDNSGPVSNTILSCTGKAENTSSTFSISHRRKREAGDLKLQYSSADRRRRLSRSSPSSSSRSPTSMNFYSSWPHHHSFPQHLLSFGQESTAPDNSKKKMESDPSSSFMIDNLYLAKSEGDAETAAAHRERLYFEMKKLSTGVDREGPEEDEEEFERKLEQLISSTDRMAKANVAITGQHQHKVSYYGGMSAIILMTVKNLLVADDSHH